MSVVITLYKTKLNAQNRMYDKNAYVSYFATLDADEDKHLTLELSEPIIPNSDFKLKAGSNPQLYNYIVFQYNGLTYGSFITKVTPFANTPTVNISHRTDNWYFALENCSIDFHGQCERSHVNEWAFNGDSGNYNPTLKNKYFEIEENCNTSNMIQTDIDLTGNENTDFKYVYLFCARMNLIATATGEDAPTVYQTYEDELQIQRACVNTVVVGCIAMKDIYILGEKKLNAGDCVFRIKTPQDTRPTSADNIINIIGLTNDNILGITITNIPPYSDCSLSYQGITSNNPYATLTKRTDLTISVVGYPKYSDVFYNINTTYAKDMTNIPQYSAYYFNDTNLSDKVSDYTSYSQFKKSIVKLFSSVYNPIFIGDKSINTMKVSKPNNFRPWRTTLSIDGTFYSTINREDNLGNSHKYVINQNNALFQSLTKTSFWDSLNAERTRVSGQQKINNAYFNLFSSTLSPLYSKSAQNDGAFAVAKSSYALGTNFTNIEYTKRLVDLDNFSASIKARYGEVSSNSQTSYYVTLFNGNLIPMTLVKQNDENIENLFRLLHKYGYNTFLTLEDVYANHRRQAFNYIQTSDCEVMGVPQDMSQDISQMFNSGVHLWSSTDVGLWEQPNYQIDIINSVQQGR